LTACGKPQQPRRHRQNPPAAAVRHGRLHNSNIN
jgi:hypothetical protein